MTGKLLIVDEAAGDRETIRNMLDDFDVLTADNGREAKRLIREQPDIDLIILDLKLPARNSLALFNELEAIHKDHRLCAVILTLDDETDPRFGGLQGEAVDFIRKPANLKLLRTRLELHLELIRIQKRYEQMIYDRDLMFNTLFSKAPIGIALLHSESPDSDDRKETIFNAEYQRITGRTREELIKLGWAKITHPDDLDKENELYNRFQAGEIDRYTMEKRYIRPDGSVAWVNIIVAQLDFLGQMKKNHICIVQDISERKAVESALLESERSKAVLLANLPGLAYRCDYDRNWTMRFISKGCYSLTGYQPESLLNNRDLSFNDLIAPEYRDYLWEQWRHELKHHQSFEHEYEIITASGQRKWVMEVGQGVYGMDGTVEALEGIVIDINDRKLKEIQLQQMSEIDPLTKLYNRRYLETMLKGAADADICGKRAVVLLSLRKINTISLNYGYSFCEEIILELTASLQKLADDRKKLFQVSFERFAFHIMEYESEDELKAFSQKVLDLIESIQILRTVGCGIGIVQFDPCTCIPENIIKNASTAAESGDKDQNFEYHFFNSEMEAAIKRETDVKDALIRLIDGSPDERLYLQYQPILNLNTNRVEEFEALARFESKTIGKVPPLEFITIAEETQLIIPLGRRIMDLASAFQRRLQDAGFMNMRIFVNVSAIQLLRSDFLADCLLFAESHGVQPESFGLEVTESAFAGNFNVINKILENLMEIGVKTAIDDFGTGYSTLARERDMKINILKIDKYFIDGVFETPRDKTVTQDIIAMAHKMGHEVVAEGVEHESQLQYLKDFNCDKIQGFLYSKPLDEEDAIAFAAANGGD